LIQQRKSAHLSDARFSYADFVIHPLTLAGTDSGGSSLTNMHSE
jgi:hypothetical protein